MDFLSFLRYELQHSLPSDVFIDLILGLILIKNTAYEE